MDTAGMINMLSAEVKAEKKTLGVKTKETVMINKFTAYIAKDIESGDYIASVPSIPGAHTQASTLDDLLVKLKEVISLCLDEMDSDDVKAIPDFIGVQQIEVAI